MGLFILRKKMSDNILNAIYYDLYAVDSSFPEIEHIELRRTGDTSNTINKEIIYLNIDAFLKSHSLETYNYIVFKAAHELAHAKCKNIGHTQDFKIIFTHLLEQLEEKNKYSDTMRKMYETKMYGKNFDS